MRLTEDLRVLAQFVRGKPKSGNHAADLDAFYGPQAAAYDRFRERLLPGRAAFMQSLPLQPGMRVIDFGAGTGHHWTGVPQSLAGLESLELVDLCAPLLAVARERYTQLARVRIVHADAQAWRAQAPADLVLFSYSLSMMPDWRAALANACANLKPGGLLAVIDFCTLPPAPAAPLTALPGFDRAFWPRWFAHDGVLLRPAVLPALMACGRVLSLHQGRARLPYLPLLRAPWFHWLGRPNPEVRF